MSTLSSRLYLIQAPPILVNYNPDVSLLLVYPSNSEVMIGYPVTEELIGNRVERRVIDRPIKVMWFNRFLKLFTKLLKKYGVNISEDELYNVLAFSDFVSPDLQIIVLLPEELATYLSKKLNLPFELVLNVLKVLVSGSSSEG